MFLDGTSMERSERQSCSENYAKASSCLVRAARDASAVRDGFVIQKLKSDFRFIIKGLRAARGHPTSARALKPP
jgi:hypothetical protein